MHHVGKKLKCHHRRTFRWVVADGNDPPGQVVDEGGRYVELGPEDHDGSPGPLDGERLYTISILGPQLHTLASSRTTTAGHAPLLANAFQFITWLWNEGRGIQDGMGFIIKWIYKCIMDDQPRFSFLMKRKFGFWIWLKGSIICGREGRCRSDKSY